MPRPVYATRSFRSSLKFDSIPQVLDAAMGVREMQVQERKMKIDSRTAAVVTGGASGLGRASAEALAAAGAKVAIFDVNDRSGEEAARSIGGRFFKVDVTSEESVLSGLAEARAA